MRWYIPSWNGDLRLESSDKKPDAETVLSIVAPTAAEKKILDAIQAEAVKQNWIPASVRAERGGFLWRKKKVVLAAPIAVVGPIVAKLMRPGNAVLTAIVFKDGKMITSSGDVADLQQAVAGGGDAAPAPPPEPKADAPTPVPEKAATVKRPTPSCPQCTPGAILPANEVLLSFLNEEEHESWAKSRSIVVEGGLSGHRYLLAHRHSALAQSAGRICYDLDNDLVVHFHDWTVPPEEEVLAAKLILEHREPWLRNEATVFGVGREVMRFKNPFGDITDGIPDANFTQRLGEALARAVRGPGGDA